MRDPVRVIIMANNIDEVGGAQRVVHLLAQGFSERGHEVTLVGVVPHVPVHIYHRNPAYRSLSLVDRAYPKHADERARSEAEAVANLQHLLDDGPAGIVITAQLWAMEHLAKCDLGDWRVIGQYHSSFEAAAGGRDLGRAQAVYRDVDRFLLLCEEDAESIAAQGFSNSGVMPNPLAYWPEVPAELRAPVVTYLGRLSAEKGPRFLLDAWRLLGPAHPSWRLQLVGSGPLGQVMRDSVADEDLRIDFMEPTDDPMSVLMGSSILALPSLTEGLPLALAEAMACGVPCVAADCSAGVRALVSDEANGLIARRGDAPHLAVQLGRLMESDELRRRLGAAARSSVEGLRLERILDRWDDLLVQTLR